MDPTQARYDEAKIQNLSALFTAVNMRVASAEALGLYFPSGSLYSIYLAFDVLSAQASELDHEMADEGYDQSHALLCAAYAFASLTISEHYLDACDEWDSKWQSTDVSKYHDYDAIKRLNRAEESFSRFSLSFDDEWIFDQTDDVMQLCDAMIGMPRDTRIFYLEKIDSWVDSTRELWSAKEDAIAVYKEAKSADKGYLKVLPWPIRITSAVLLIPSIVQIAYKIMGQ